MNTEQEQPTTPTPVTRTLIIRSSEWLRGKGGDQSGLYRDGRYCCLGLDALSVGVMREDLLGCDFPSCLRLPSDRHRVRHWLSSDTTDDTELAEEAANINDDTSTDDEQKISLLRPIFLQVGIEIDWRPEE